MKNWRRRRWFCLGALLCLLACDRSADRARVGELAREAAQYEGGLAAVRLVEEARFMAVSSPGSTRVRRAVEMKRMLESLAPIQGPEEKREVE